MARIYLTADKCDSGQERISIYDLHSVLISPSMYWLLQDTE